MKTIILSILILGTFISQNSGAFVEISTDQASKTCRLQSNIDNEKSRLTELYELLTLPEYQDQTDFYTQELLNKVEESIAIIEYYQDCLAHLNTSQKSIEDKPQKNSPDLGNNDCFFSHMYPNRSFESLMQEAQLNCLGPVELVLHKDRYFHIPKPITSSPVQRTQ